jgi:hypothetical protein
MHKQIHKYRNKGMMALDWLGFAVSFATIAWISFRTTGG